METHGDNQIYHYFGQSFFDDYEVMNMLREDRAVDGSNGGIVLGPSHAGGGVFILQSTAIGYKVHSEVEGYEYIFGPAAKWNYEQYHDRLNTPFTKEEYEAFLPYDVPEEIRVIDARPASSGGKPKFILMDDRGFGFSIYNRCASKTNLSLLDELNRCISYQYNSESWLATNHMDIIAAESGEKLKWVTLL